MQKHILQIVEARSYTRENGAGMRLLVNDRSIFLHSLHNHSTFELLEID